jgi:hypothetical protein
MARRVLLFGFVVALVNCLIGMAMRVCYHGDASLGYVLNGHSYFGVPGHYTEVPFWLWQFSWWQIPILFATQPIGIICALFLWPTKWLRRLQISN